MSKGWKKDPKKEFISLEDIETKHSSKKNTRKWCKGKVGVVHEGKWEVDMELGHLKHDSTPRFEDMKQKLRTFLTALREFEKGGEK